MSGEAIRDRIIKYIFDSGLFDNVSGEVQAAVVSLIDDAFMDKIKRYMAVAQNNVARAPSYETGMKQGMKQGYETGYETRV